MKRPPIIKPTPEPTQIGGGKGIFTVSICTIAIVIFSLAFVLCTPKKQTRQSEDCAGEIKNLLEQIRQKDSLIDTQTDYINGLETDLYNLERQ